MRTPANHASTTVALATPSFAADTSDKTDLGQSTFVAPENNVAFGFTVPENSGEDVFITIRAPIDRQWAAIGLGQTQMAGSLILMIYRDETGNNVTFSPRVAYGNYEPSYYDHVTWDVLPGTGVFNGSMYFSARCTAHCRNWPGGYVDVSSETQKAIYAVGPKGGFFSSKIDSSVKFHEEFGRFTINMKRTIGPGDAPALKDDAVNEGTAQIDAYDGKRDLKSIFHALMMVGALVFLMPVGVVLLRLGDKVRWHGLNQGVALLLVIIGFVLGVLTSFWYNRVSRGSRLMENSTDVSPVSRLHLCAPDYWFDSCRFLLWSICPWLPAPLPFQEDGRNNDHEADSRMAGPYHHRSRHLQCLPVRLRVISRCCQSANLA